MNGNDQGLVQSVHQRLVNLAHQGGEETQAVLTRFGIERLLYRLSVSPHGGQFILKGAMLFRVWSGALHRPTTDLDLLGFGRNDHEHLEDVFRAVCMIEVEPDGLAFDAESVRAAAIREDQEYEGVRVRMVAYLGRARILLQVDVGFGDAVVPEPQVTDYPAMLNFPQARLRTYSKESVVAEKFQAMVALGVTNSRLKDFYDVWILSQQETFDGETLCRALTATFGHRRTPLPASTPLALTEEFWRPAQGDRVVGVPAAIPPGGGHGVLGGNRARTAGLPDAARVHCPRYRLLRVYMATRRAVALAVPPGLWSGFPRDSGPNWGRYPHFYRR